MNYFRLFGFIIVLFVLTEFTFGQTHFDLIPEGDKGIKTGPGIGAKIPEFSLPDQHGNIHGFSTLAGPKGAIILFYRSADW